MSLEKWQTELRKQFAADQKFELKNIGDYPVFSDFEVFNPDSGKSYKVSVRDNKNSFNFCSCPDGINSEIFNGLISTDLFPYQREGVIKIIEAGRILLADEMGLGKTIQAIAAIEIFALCLS